MSPAEIAELDQMSVSQRIEEYRRRSGELSSAELALAIGLIRKARSEAVRARPKAKEKGTNDPFEGLAGLA